MASEPTKHGRARYSYLNLFAKVSWIYSVDDFKALPKNKGYSRWKDGVEVMAERERVVTDHDEWIRIKRVNQEKREPRRRPKFDQSQS